MKMFLIVIQAFFQVDPTPYKLPTPTPFPTLDATPFLQLPLDLPRTVADGAIQTWNLLGGAGVGAGGFALGWFLQAMILLLIVMGLVYWIYALLVRWFVSWARDVISGWGRD